MCGHGMANRGRGLPRGMPRGYDWGAAYIACLGKNTSRMSPNYRSRRIFCPFPSAATSSAMAMQVTGWRQSGAMSRSGPSTNSRSASRGWGISSNPSERRTPSQSMMSISRVRAAFAAAGRTRPRRFSIAWQASSNACGDKSHRTPATPFTKFGCSEAGMGALSYHGEQAVTLIPAVPRRVIAAAQFCRASPWTSVGKFEPIAR